MSEDDDTDFTSANRSANNLSSLFRSGEPATMTTAAPLKQPKKDSSPRIMIANVVQAFLFGADQKWISRGKLGVAILSTENTMFQLILYVKKTEYITTARISASFVLKCQVNNYLTFQDDGGQNWSIMFDTKQALVDFISQIIVAKAHLLSFKFDHLIQDTREGEGAALVDHDSVEITVNVYKLNENGAISSIDTGDVKPIRFKIGKNQNGKEFDNSLRGMKKNSQRIVMIGTTIYNIEVIRVKREKETRTNSITVPIEEQPVIEQKRTTTDESETNNEQKNLLKRIRDMGGVSMLQNQTSAFTAPLPSHLPSFSSDDSVNHELLNHSVSTRPIPTTVLPPAAQYVSPMYQHPPHQSAVQSLAQQPNLYPAQPILNEYASRPGSSMSALSYPQVSMWPQSAYSGSTPNVPSIDVLHHQQYPNDIRQLLGRLTEKVDFLNEKLDTKNSISYPNMETSILLANIQRIVKENDNMKKDLFDRSAKVEELNLKITELLDRNQRLIEQTHQTAAQRNDVVNNVSEQTAQRILDLERQKVELTNNLSMSTSKIAELQLQINKHAQDTNENQSRINTLIHQCEQYKDDAQKSENRSVEAQNKLDSIQEQLKHEKTTRKQLQINLNLLQEELAETKTTCATLEKSNNERKTKFENERKRWQEDIDEQKQSFEKELDELRSKLRKQRTADNLTNSQEISRIEHDLEREWQEKLNRQQAQHERVLASKVKELEQLKVSVNESEVKLQAANEQCRESKDQSGAQAEQCKALQERIVQLREKLIEMNEEQSEAISDQVKRTVSLIYQRLKLRIRPTKQYTGEQFLSRSLDIMKKVTLKVLSNDDGDNVTDEQSAASESNEENEPSEINQENRKTAPPSVEDSVDQETHVAASLPVITQSTKASETSESSSVPAIANNQQNGWDTVDDLQEEAKIQSEVVGEIQNVLETQDTSSTDNQIEEPISNTNMELDHVVSTNEEMQLERADDDTKKEIQEINNEKVSPDTAVFNESNSSEHEEIEEEAQGTSPTVPSAVSVTNIAQAPISTKYTFSENIPLMPNVDESDDDMFK